MKTVFFDIDTQLDFLVPGGALYVPGAEKIIPRIAELNRQAPLLVSTADAHAENDAEFKLYPPHCVAGTLGQHKPACTMVGQFILEKQALDCFTNPALDVKLREWNAERYVVYGVVTEICVRYAAFGLLKYGKPVSIVANAVKALDEAAAEKMFAEFRQRGGEVR
ncbi:MAG TPA: isochorismatase family cysteine hydrolase [Bryobacteraceae bacterium]|nr:isochorismatase family cysteine hydrolase [Bryobacteraceae bacterium]